MPLPITTFRFVGGYIPDTFAEEVEMEVQKKEESGEKSVDDEKTDEFQTDDKIGDDLENDSYESDEEDDMQSGD